MSSMNTNTYRLGGTQMIVGLSSIAEFVPPAGCNGVFFKLGPTGATVCISNGAGGPFWTNQMPQLSSTETFSFEGPVKFYLAAAGATAIVPVGISISSGGGTMIAGG